VQSDERCQGLEVSHLWLRDVISFIFLAFSDFRILFRPYSSRHFSSLFPPHSGGERSFTTLSLLLALGENLETPFRVMDEFDVFLDPVSRKIALETMISIGKEMEHRQFIFITPQDLGSIKTDDKLKIFKMKNPKRGDVVGGPQQQTLPFGSPN